MKIALKNPVKNPVTTLPCDNFDCIGIVWGRLTSWVLFTYGISYTFRTLLKTTDFRVVLIRVLRILPFIIYDDSYCVTLRHYLERFCDHIVTVYEF